MAFLEGVVFAVLLICLLFIIRLYIVVKSEPKYKPGTKGPIAVLVVAGSGNVNALTYIYVQRYILFSAVLKFNWYLIRLLMT